MELVRQMRVGEQSALEGLYARYGSLIFTLTLALRIVAGHTQVEIASGPAPLCDRLLSREKNQRRTSWVEVRRTHVQPVSLQTR